MTPPQIVAGWDDEDGWSFFIQFDTEDEGVVDVPISEPRTVALLTEYRESIKRDDSGLIHEPGAGSVGGPSHVGCGER